MPFATDTTNWSGEGTFTQLLIDRLRDVHGVAAVRVEDAPSTRSDADYNFISNELFVGFEMVDRTEAFRRFGIIPATRIVAEKSMTLAALESALTAIAEIGAPDY